MFSSFSQIDGTTAPCRLHGMQVQVVPALESGSQPSRLESHLITNWSLQAYGNCPQSPVSRSAIPLHALVFQAGAGSIPGCPAKAGLAAGSCRLMGNSEPPGAPLATGRTPGCGRVAPFAAGAPPMGNRGCPAPGMPYACQSSNALAQSIHEVSGLENEVLVSMSTKAGM